MESSFLLRQGFTTHQLSKDNRPIVFPLFLMLLHAKDIWGNIHAFLRGGGVVLPVRLGVCPCLISVPVVGSVRVGLVHSCYDGIWIDSGFICVTKPHGEKQED